MNILWGLLMTAIGVFLLVSGATKSKFIVYRLLVARSRPLWGEGDAVHRFHLFSGLIISILGILWALGVIWSS